MSYCNLHKLGNVDVSFDICAKVFRIKSQELRNDIQVKGVLGECVGIAMATEFQKRGFTHDHMLSINSERDKPQSPDDYDIENFHYKFNCQYLPL